MSEDLARTATERFIDLGRPHLVVRLVILMCPVLILVVAGRIGSLWPPVVLLAVPLAVGSAVEGGRASVGGAGCGRTGCAASGEAYASVATSSNPQTLARKARGAVVTAVRVSKGVPDGERR